MEVTKANLATYLAGLTPSATPYPIEITETFASDWGNSVTSGTVGNIIKTNTPSGVYLDLGLTIIPSSVTGMSYTFYTCTSLTTAPVIPNSVTDMEGTFYGCTSLTTAPVIPNSVIYMTSTFRNCISLTTAPVIPNSVTDMYRTFYDCTSLHTIQNFAVDVDNCDMTSAFQNCPALANIYVTTLTESSWHLLHTDTDATGTDYTIYNPDGTVAGNGTVAGTSQVLTLYGKSDELVISANITPTLAEETATSQVQWHKSGLPYDDELLIFNAKNPDTVISNFITVNRAGEEFLGNSATATLAGKAKDSYPIPTDAVLQYSFDEIKQLPDNPAGTVYKRDNDWTSVDGWSAFGSPAMCVVSVEDTKLKLVASGSYSIMSIQKTIPSNAKISIFRLLYDADIVSIQYYNGATYAPYTLIRDGDYYIATGYVNNTGGIHYLRINYPSAEIQATKTQYIETIYIGDGSYLDPVIDNSYSEAHAENHGVIPVNGVCGKAGYFNNSYMIAPRPALGDDITVYFWAKFDALGTQTILQSRTVTGSGLSVFHVSSTYRLDWRGNQSTFTGYTPPVNTWHHVCMKMNATTAVLKINGETKVTLTGTYGTTTALASTIWSGLLGTGGTPSGTPLTGALDGLKIVPRYTTDDEDTGEYKARANLPKFYAKSDLTSIVTLRRSANFTLTTYLDGQKIRIANTHATNTITCTLPTGQTMNGQASFTIAPDTLLEFELIGTAWKYIGKTWLYITLGNVNGWQNYGSGSNFYYQYNFDTVCIHCYEWYGYNATSSICGIIPVGLRPIERIGFSGANINAGDTVAAVSGSISPEGNIMIHQGTSMYKLNFTVTYKYR